MVQNEVWTGVAADFRLRFRDDNHDRADERRDKGDEGQNPPKLSGHNFSFFLAEVITEGLARKPQPHEEHEEWSHRRDGRSSPEGNSFGDGEQK